MGQVRADGRGHGFLNQIDFTRAGGLGGFLDGPLLHLGNARGHADHDPGTHQAARIVHFGDEVAQHGLGHFKVGDDAVLHGTDGPDVAGGSAEHALGVVAHGQHHVIAARILFDCHHRGSRCTMPWPLT